MLFVMRQCDRFAAPGPGCSPVGKQARFPSVPLDPKALLHPFLTIVIIMYGVKYYPRTIYSWRINYFGVIRCTLPAKHMSYSDFPYGRAPE